MPFYKLFRDPEPDAGAKASLRGKERLENLIEILASDAVPSVTYDRLETLSLGFSDASCRD